MRIITDKTRSGDITDGVVREFAERAVGNCWNVCAGYHVMLKTFGQEWTERTSSAFKCAYAQAIADRVAGAR